MSFASDNCSGIHPEVLAAIEKANHGSAVSYGGDPWTEKAEGVFKRHFGQDTHVGLVFNGTAANVLALQTLNRPYHAILCSEGAHINEDECGAPEKFTGSKLITVPHQNGKITPEALKNCLRGVGSQHHVQPKTISISQTTEFGTVYQPDEIRALSKFAREHGLYLHMDGARISNAAASLNLSLREATRDLGVDVLSFGGTKNGLMGAEAVVIFHPELAKDFAFIRKQGMQLASKMRFVSAQFIALLEGDLWLRNAKHANSMAKKLAEGASQVPGVKIARPPQANGVFAILPHDVIAPLQEKFSFHVWNEQTNEVRWMTAFDTREEVIDLFIAELRAELKRALK
jgi:threonine aldolase